MSVARHHAEWMSLVESSGPFLSMPVLLRIFPQGLDPRDSAKAGRLREAYEDWLDRGVKRPDVHFAWIRHVLTDLLEYPAEFLVEGQAIPPGMEANMPNVGETLRPTFVLKHRDADKKPLLLIEHYPPGQDLAKPVTGKLWKATPGTRMMELLHAADVPLGLITNGEEWMLVYAPRGETTGFASWYADIWMQEPITLRAFHSLLHLRRFLGVAEPETLAAMYAESSKDQQEVTDQLGYQVRQAVEMLVQAFDRIDAESGRTLLAGVAEKALYDSALTVMMRLVFLFSADERGLLLLGDPLYDQHYAVSTLSELLRERADRQTEEVLERQHDAWCRLLATFRAVHGGVQHESMRLPAYGGTLFDPDRYPFLEGRAAGTHWHTTPAKPLPINNRVVLHLLEALQVLRVKVPGGGPTEARRISFRALDIEQIGHVYEGLLDHTATRAGETILGLAGSKNREPEIPLSKLEELATKGNAALIEFLKEETGRSDKALKRLIETPPILDEHALLIACCQDWRLADRIKPFAVLVRPDSFDRLAIIPEGSVYVTAGSDRRSTGTHYTPRSLTEPIVEHTLEPLTYIGPAAGTPKAEWKLKPSRELLALKVCDMAMGSGAFLVQTCRYLSERLVESWENAEKEHPGCFVITPEGELSTGSPSERLMPKDPAERIAIARRYVADRCLYGVDINPMAVEMAKLSLWLITLQKDRPFTFLDHAFKCGDSLLGVSSVKQIETFSLRPGERQFTFATSNLFRYVDDASTKRRALEDLPSNNHTQIEIKSRLHAEAESATAKVKAVADCLIAFELRGLEGKAYEDQRAEEAETVQLLMKRDADASLTSETRSTHRLSEYSSEQLRGRRTFHWAVEFPEVVARGGFDAFVGNPPFKAGRFLSRDLGRDYLAFLQRPPFFINGQADYCAAFSGRAFMLCSELGIVGLIVTKTISEGDTREAFLAPALREGGRLLWVMPLVWWPGNAAVVVSLMIIERSRSQLQPMLNGVPESEIDSTFSVASSVSGEPKELVHSSRLVAKGVGLGYSAFVLTFTEGEPLHRVDPIHVRRFISGNRHNSSADGWGGQFVFWFQDIPDIHSLIALEVGRIFVRKVETQRQAGTFWKYRRSAEGLSCLMNSSRLCIIRAQTSSTWTFSFWPKDDVFDQSVIVFGTNCAGLWALLNSQVHEAWAGKFGRLMKTDTAYAPSNSFNTFPLPYQPLNACNQDLARISEKLSVFRNGVEIALGGKTTTYNRFHNRVEQSADIVRLRALHKEMDQAVAAAYGWSELDLDHGFHATKQGERYTISEPARRTVLEKLLELNHQRYDEEVKAGLHDKKKSGGQGCRGHAKPNSHQPADLFAEDE
jgi:hypothetical protein